jgi:histidinol-phosphate aminotransferase
MALTRRHFVEALGAASASALSGARVFAQGAAPAKEPSAAPGLPPIRLDQNENPYGPGDAVSRAVLGALGRGNRYPGAEQGELMDAIAAMHGVKRENVLLSAGSAELLKASVLAFVNKDRHLVAGLPTFETCTGTAQAMGYPVREIPIDASLRLDLPAMETAAVGAGLIFFCNPNNPTGTTWPTRDLEAMIDRLTTSSPDTVTLVDEAYFHYVERPDYSSLAGRAAKDKHVLVTRTFSKAHGLAGMRIGYAIGHKETIENLRRSTTSGRLSLTSAAAAIEALKQEALVSREVRRNRESRAATARIFEEMGFKVFPSDANFILVDVRRKTADFQAVCKDKGVLVGRPFAGLPTHSRISFGTPEEMKRAATVFRAVLGQPA